MPPPRGELTISSIQKIDAISTHIRDLFSQASKLHHEARNALVLTERESAGIEFRAMRDRIQGEMERFREELEKINLTDVAGMYAVAGYTKEQSIEKAKEDLSGLREGMESVKNALQRMVADVVYGGPGG